VVRSQPCSHAKFRLRINAGVTIQSSRFGVKLLPAEEYDIYTTVTGRLLGLLTQAMGHLGNAMDHFEDALSFSRKAGYRPELAWTFCDYADMLLDLSTSPTSSRLSTPGRSSRRTVSDDRAKATALLDESLAIYGELGLKPLMGRVLSRRETLGA